MSDPDFTSDPWLDARLRNVPLPVGFLAKLHEIGNAETQQLDRALRDVPLPEGMLDRLRLISRQPQHFPVWRRMVESGVTVRQLALAASLLVAVGLGGLGLVNLRMKSGQPLAQQTSGEAETAREADGRFAEGRAGNGPGQLGRNHDDLAQETRLRDETEAALERESLDMEFDGGELDPARVALDDLAPRAVPELGPGPAPALPKLPRRSLTQLQREELLGFGGGADVLPDLDAVEVFVPRGLTPPRVAGYDLLFQLKHGLHPLVNPSAHKDLRSVQLPLVTSSAGYRRAWRWLKEGRLPAAGDLRSEEFLAAMDYGFPAVGEGKLAIRAAGGPAPLRDEGMSLLQVAVQAGALPHEAHGPTHLTIVLDTSSGMRRPDRWAAVQAAIGRLRAPMGPADHVTLISYSDQPELLVDSVGREDAGQLLSALQTSQSRRTANLAAGLNLACSVMPHPAETALPVEAAPIERRILVISSGRVDIDSQSTERVRGRLTELTKSGVSLQVLDLGRDNRAASGGGNAGENNSSDALASWTEAVDGRLIRIADPSTLPWNVIEALIGRSPVVAAHTSLQVSFNPNVVAAYRLIGHERTTITGPSQAQTEVDLRAGESATGLFEVWLKPIGPNNIATSDVATVNVSWQMPDYGKSQHVKQSITRGQFARSFEASAPSLQVAALAASTAETLRGSTFAPASRSLSRVMELSRQVSPSVLGQPSVRELTDFMQLAERVRLHGAALRRNAARAAGGQ